VEQSHAKHILRRNKTKPLAQDLGNEDLDEILQALEKI
jgi:hypothetical protein